MKKTFAKIFVVALAIVSSASFFSLKTTAATELDDEKLTAISTSCSIIKDNIKTIQHEDSKNRDHLGGYYNYILSNFIKPLNIVLVNNNMSTSVITTFSENQNNYVSAFELFDNDYRKNQKDLEELLSIDCTTEPIKFYNKLVVARKSRAKVADDITTINNLIEKQRTSVSNLKETL